MARFFKNGVRAIYYVAKSLADEKRECYLELDFPNKDVSVLTPYLDFDEFSSDVALFFLSSWIDLLQVLRHLCHFVKALLSILGCFVLPYNSCAQSALEIPQELVSMIYWGGSILTDTLGAFFSLLIRPCMTAVASCFPLTASASREVSRKGPQKTFTRRPQHINADLDMVDMDAMSP